MVGIVPKGIMVLVLFVVFRSRKIEPKDGDSQRAERRHERHNWQRVKLVFMSHVSVHSISYFGIGYFNRWESSLLALAHSHLSGISRKDLSRLGKLFVSPFDTAAINFTDSMIRTGISRAGGISSRAVVAAPNHILELVVRVGLSFHSAWESNIRRSNKGEHGKVQRFCCADCGAYPKVHVDICPKVFVKVTSRCFVEET